MVHSRWPIGDEARSRVKSMRVRVDVVRTRAGELVEVDDVRLLRRLGKGIDGYRSLRRSELLLPLKVTPSSGRCVQRRG